MRKIRYILPLAALALALGAMPAASLAANGGTTSAIVKDVAKDGKVDGHYTTAQLKAALKSPLLSQYGGQGAVESILSRIKPKKTVTSAPATGPSSNLPFTGADIFLFVAVGGGLLGAGLVLRRLGRNGDDEAAA